MHTQIRIRKPEEISITWANCVDILVVRHYSFACYQGGRQQGTVHGISVLFFTTAQESTIISENFN